MNKHILVGLGVLGLLFVGVFGYVSPVQPLESSEADSLTILGSPDEDYVRGVARAFQLETGVRTSYVRLSSGEALATLQAERSAPRFSVWWGGPVDGYISAKADGLLEPYRPKGSAKLPRRYKDEQGAWTGVYVGALALAVNTKVLAEGGLPPPTSWADLIRPIYRGQIAIAHPASSGTAYTTLATIMQLHGRNVEAGFHYLEALHQNVLRYERAGAAPARLAGRGEAAIGIAFAHDIVAAIDDGFADLTVVFPEEGTGYEIGAMALVANAPATRAGQQFMDWAVGERAQELGPLYGAYQIPTNPDARVPRQSVRLASVKTIDYDFEWAGEQRQALIDRFSATIAPPIARAR